MKLIHAFVILFAIVFYHHFTHAVSTTKFFRQSPQVIRLTRKNLNSNRVAGIVCFYAKNGRWPQYPRNWRPFVAEFARRIFAMTDANIKRYCQRVFQLNYFNWPVSFQPTIKINTVKQTLAPKITPIFYSTSTMGTIQPISTYSTYTTLSSTTQSYTTPSSTINIPQVLSSTTSSTTTQVIFPTNITTTTKTPPAASATGSASYTGTNSGSYSGSYSGSASGSAALTGQSQSMSDKLIQFPNDSGIKSFRKVKNGDIIVKWIPSRIRLRQINM